MLTGVTDPIVSLDADRVSVEPGGQASVGIKITNPGTIVEGYRVEVVGHGVADWGEAVPPEISVYPKQDATAVVVFSPPGGTGAQGGTWPFGVRVRSTEDPDASAVAEGDLEIGKVFGLQAKLVPVNSSGRWNGRHVIQLSNWGNSPARLKLTASNPDEALGFMIRPDVVELPLGGTANARIWAKTKKPFLRGTPTRIPFTVVGEQEGAPVQTGPMTLPYGGTPDRPSVDGAFNQKPILSKGVVVLSVLALLAIAGGVVWALRLPKPQEATFQELGVPDQPKGVTVQALSGESARVAWQPVQNIESYTVVQIDETGRQFNSQTVAATDNAKDIAALAPGAKVCFKVQAVRGAVAGPLSDQGCAALPSTASPTAEPTGQPSSPGASDSAGASPGGSASSAGTSGGAPVDSGGGPGVPNNGQSSAAGSPGTNPTNGGGTGAAADTAANPALKGKWVAASFWPVSGTLIDGQKLLATLRSQQLPSGLAQSTLYPTSVPPFPNPSWILYVGPFDTSADALAACPKLTGLGRDCYAIQLAP